jgi:hypothetical protein
MTNEGVTQTFEAWVAEGQGVEAPIVLGVVVYEAPIVEYTIEGNINRFHQKNFDHSLTHSILIQK